MQAAPGAPDVLRRLRARGCRLGVISNWSADLPELLGTLGMGDAFDAVIASESVGVEKPDDRIFIEALARLGVGASRCVHVGDDPGCDVAPARRVGMIPVLVDPDDRHPRVRCVRVHALGELPALLTPPQ